jgi:hypothetical protein
MNSLQGWHDQTSMPRADEDRGGGAAASWKQS